MKKFGYTFEQALFDKDVGAIWFYPSSLIQSIMQTIIQSSKKSIKTAGDSMMVISRYLKDMHNVKEEIDEILGETISSMKFLGTGSGGGVSNTLICFNSSNISSSLVISNTLFWFN